MLTIGSLFSGVGGLELGLERAGLGPVLWQAEQDPYCQRVLAKHWPEAKRYDDVRDIDGSAERVDIICGGFPCQDVSNAGKRAGMAGERSGLWREFARIVRELRPRFVVVENVSALLGRGFGDVLGDLAACGYDAQWDCIPAAAVGAHHRRDRLFIIAHANGEHCGLQPRRGSGQSRSDSAQPAHDGKEEYVADAHRKHLERCGQTVRSHAGEGLQSNPNGRDSGERASDGWWSSEPSVGRVADGVPARAHRLRALGNAVVPQVAEVIGRVIVGMV